MRSCDNSLLIDQTSAAKVLPVELERGHPGEGMHVGLGAVDDLELGPHGLGGLAEL